MCILCVCVYVHPCVCTQSSFRERWPVNFIELCVCVDTGCVNESMQTHVQIRVHTFVRSVFLGSSRTIELVVWNPGHVCFAVSQCRLVNDLGWPRQCLLAWLRIGLVRAEQWLCCVCTIRVCARVSVPAISRIRVYCYNLARMDQLMHTYICIIYIGGV